MAKKVNDLCGICFPLFTLLMLLFNEANFLPYFSVFKYYLNLYMGLSCLFWQNLLVLLFFLVLFTAFRMKYNISMCIICIFTTKEKDGKTNQFIWLISLYYQVKICVTSFGQWSES